MSHQPSYFLAVCLLLLSGCSTPPAEHSLAGMSEAAVRQRWGPPHHEFADHYGNPPLAFAQKFHGQIKTLVFQESRGEVYVSFELRNGTWVAICNSWLPRGAVF